VESSEEHVSILRLKQLLFGATVYELQKLRCNLCGTIFTARTPRHQHAAPRAS
jgi:transposase